MEGSGYWRYLVQRWEEIVAKKIAGDVEGAKRKGEWIKVKKKVDERGWTKKGNWA